MIDGAVRVVVVVEVEVLTAEVGVDEVTVNSGLLQLYLTQGYLVLVLRIGQSTG